MNKISNPFLVLAIALFSLSGFAQDRLIRVDSTSNAWRQNDLTLSLYDRELARLLVPKNSQFGVIRVPNIHSESSLTYDSVNHTLVYIKAFRNIYEATSMATTKRKKIGDKVRQVPRKHIYNYAAPEVGTYTLNITDEQAQKLKEVWTNAIQNAEAKEEELIFNDPTWEFFIGNQRAKSYLLQNTLVELANELMDSVYNCNWRTEEARKMNCNKIEWINQDSLEHIGFADTCRIKDYYFKDFPQQFIKDFTRELKIQGKSYYCCFLPIGSGESIFLVNIYKQGKSQWENVARGRVYGPKFITADFDSINNKIVFTMLDAIIDTYSLKIKSFIKVGEIGELSLADLDSIGESEESMQIAEIRASFPGGQRELMSWLAQNMHYPEKMKEIQGRVLVSFYVEKDGSISDVNVERPCIKEDGTSSTVIVEQSEMSALDKEVIRVVKTMPQWEPAMHHGKPVREKHFLPLNIDPQ